MQKIKIMLTIAIMQPYFFPYIGYFQLMNAVDQFVIYDNIQYTKKGWINRNRILVNGKDEYITIPIMHGSHCLDIRERFLSDTWSKDRKHILNRLSELYREAPYFRDAYPVIEQCLLYEENNLFNFNFYSLNIVKDYLTIHTPFIISSTINIDHRLKGEKKVLEICKALGATNYINPIGGRDLYQKDQFEKSGIQIKFLKAENIRYPQFDNKFIPNLSIIDFMMFNDKLKIIKNLNIDFKIE